MPLPIVYHINTNMSPPQHVIQNNPPNTNNHQNKPYSRFNSANHGDYNLPYSNYLTFTYHHHSKYMTCLSPIPHLHRRNISPVCLLPRNPTKSIPKYNNFLYFFLIRLSNYRSKWTHKLNRNSMIYKLFFHSNNSIKPKRFNDYYTRWKRVSVLM